MKIAVTYDNGQIYQHFGHCAKFKLYEAEDGTYYVLFDGLNAGQMRQEVYMTIYNGKTPVSNTACYSIESYAFQKQNDANLGDLVKAMMKYGDAANEYSKKVG